MPNSTPTMVPPSTGELYRRYAAAVQSGKESRMRDRMLAGGVGGIITALFMTPFDVVKIRLQAQTKPLNPGDKFVLHDGILDHLCTCLNGNHVSHNETCEVNVRKIAWYRRPSQFTGTMDAFKKIARNEGVGSLWSGLYPTILLSIPTVAVYYSCYDVIKDSMGYDKRPNSLVIPLVASSSARTLACVMFCPFEVLRTKMQSEKIPPGKLLMVVRNQVGFSSLFLGLKPSLFRDVPFSMIYWSLLEFMRRRMSERFNMPLSSFTINFVAGSVSGGVAAIATLPFDVVKTQSQIELGSKNFSHSKSVPVFENLMSIWLKTGTKGLFTGIIPRLLRVVPACGIMLSTYEVLKHVLTIVK